ncbi:uncharacterized protein LOC125592025 [Brassica napus]|uniref:uncharacterized protein LOC125592025 n=1 Tax=Brassica napus TaxID=3708 RepID=UPI00207A3C37|nr:uncharacterized protein LOC125592025 [Brassica napus]
MGMGNEASYAEDGPYEENILGGDFGSTEIPEDLMEEPNEEQYEERVFEDFEAANQPLYDGCVEGISQLYLASRLMKVKTDHNLAESCMDEISQTFRDVLPQPNIAPESYYEMKKLTKSLGLPVVKIDICEDNCMLFWKEDSGLLACRFCGKDRFHKNHGKGKRRPKQRMFYLPITERLKRLYQQESTASQMRWHAEHESPEGEMHHPSDAAAWKHFNKVYPDFAEESRNVYLGLATNGFNPVGMSGEAHSVWPVIVTPYNLLPAYDVSKKQKFSMRAALMWTINDFPAYGMMSGWMTHGRLACPYCLDDTKSFWLQHGRKYSWFDCHRMFLPKEHPYRRNVQAFRKGQTVTDDPPRWLTGEEILRERINNIEGLKKTIDCGGNGHEKPASIINGYGKDHNWVKKSIFWELPYWENLLLRHNVDFMHVEKNFFDNLINTVLNVPGKTKDNAKSRMDLPDLCRRWRLLPFAFKELLPKSVHIAISEIALFFRDISAKILKHEDVAILKENIAVKLCNLEKIFPPSFFDVMEHLAVHLADEAALGGPVQYRWMYPFERYMMFEEFMTERNPYMSTNDLQILKDQHFAEWVKNYVVQASNTYEFPMWMLDFVQGPQRKYKSWPIYHSRGYCFHTQCHGQDKKTQHYGVQVRGTIDTDYYGLIEEIIMVEYFGSVGLKAMVFKCKWFDTTEGRGIRKHKSGIIDVSPRWQYEKYDPFILSGNCDQVCFIPYPRVRHTSANDWWACTKVMPRGVRETSEDALVALQDETHNQVVAQSVMLRIETYVVEDDSDYESTPVVPPNDEYVSEDELDEACTDSDSESDSSS